MDNVMQMDWRIEGSDLFIALSGRLDTLRAMNLDDRLNDLPENVTSIYFDFENLEYIASSGLRILYWAVEYTDEKGGSMSVKNVSPEVQEVFSITGFSELIDIE